MREIPLSERLILALDAPTRSDAIRLFEQTRGVVGTYKVGLELFIAEGPAFVSWLREQGVQVFLDLKLHDIPNTVAAAVARAAQCGVSLLTVHALGGARMMEAACRAAQEALVGEPTHPLRLLAVSVLTHHRPDELGAIGLVPDPAAVVERLVALARDAGLPGCVCSPQEIAAVRAQMGDEFLIVTPGIRPAGAALGDQTRVATPSAAMRDGADFLVVGRPIHQAEDPERAAAEILADMKQGLEARREII